MPATRIKPSDVKRATAKKPYRRAGAPPHNAALREELKQLMASISRKLDNLEKSQDRLSIKLGTS